MLKIPRDLLQRPLYVALILGVFTFVFSLSMVVSGDKVGLGDWQYYTFLWETSKYTILDYHQLPLWNPYEVGGNIYLAHPNTHFLSPLHLLLLPIDTAIAHKIVVMVHIFLALLGVYFVATRIYKTSPAAGFVAAVVFTCSGFFGWRLQGQLEKIGLYLLPWVFYFFVRSEERLRNVVWAALVLTAIVLEGGAAYPFAFIVLFLGAYTVFQFFERKYDFRIVGLFALTVALTFCFSAVRFLPMLDYLRDYPRVISGDDKIEFPLLADIYFGRRTMPHWQWPNKGYKYGWWGEYGNYLGVPLFALFLTAIVAKWREYKKLLFLCLLFFLVSLGMHGSFSPYEIFHQVPFFRGLRVPTRFNVLLFFPLALVLARFIDVAWGYLKERAYPRAILRKAVPIAFVVVLAGAVVDYAFFNQTMLWGAFRNRPLSSFPRGATFRQVAGDGHYAYEGPRMNFGSINFYEEMQIKKSAALKGGLPSEVYLERPEAGQVALKRWTPNRLEIEVDAAEPNSLVLVNMNHHKHWKADGAKVVNHKDLIGLIPAQAGKSTIELYYQPTPFLIGAALSLLSLGGAAALLFWLRRRDKRAAARPAAVAAA